MSTTAVSPLEAIRNIEEKALANLSLTDEEALSVLRTPDEYVYDLIASANRVRRHFKGDEISLCSIINAKSGHCPEDCAFCSQSAHASTNIESFDFVGSAKVVEGAKAALESGAHKFGIVTSGYGYSGKGPKQDMDQVLAAVEALKEGVDIHRCASLGIIDEATARKLKEAGALEYHHNLETARSYFPNVCTTHEYDEDLETVKAVKRAGLRICCGGILGLGESEEQRVELAMTLRELDVDSVPVNFLNPIEGTKMAGAESIRPLDILKIIAMFRMVLPDKDIKVAGGREKNLRDLQCLMFAAGANSTMVGNYLTTMGRPAADDLQMIGDLGLLVREE